MIKRCTIKFDFFQNFNRGRCWNPYSTVFILFLATLSVCILRHSSLGTSSPSFFVNYPYNHQNSSTNRPFPGFLLSLCQNVSTCKTIHMRMSSPRCSFSCKSNSHENSKDLARRVALKGWGTTRKWSIRR